MKYIFTIIFISVMISALAQDYKNSAGFRLGKTDGVTYKRFLNEMGAIEFMLGFDGHDNGMQAYSTYQWYRPLPTKFTENLYWYFGVGGHVGYIKRRVHRDYYFSDSTVITRHEKQTYYAIGVDGVVGLEYRIFTVPMTVGMELKPYFEYYGLRYTQFKFWDFALTVKYIF